MDVTPAASYLRLGQFLDLERRWSDAADAAELAHRICATVSILLRTPATAIGIARAVGDYAILAHSADWAEPPERQSILASRALNTNTVQLKSGTDAATGVFPFKSGTLAGCLHVAIERPLFDATEIAFLRFVASLAAMALDCAPRDPPALIDEATIAADRTNTAGAITSAVNERSARRYVAMAAHDLRNPLNVVMGYADLLSDGTLGELNSAQAEAAGAIARQADTLLTVVDEIMDLDRLVAASTSSVPSRFELRTLFDELRTRCFRDREDAVDWPGAEAAFEFTSDRRKVFSIAQNLIDNALRHGGGTVRVHCTRRDGRLVIEVSDGGPGMPDKLKKGLVATAAGQESDLSAAGLGLYTSATWIRTLAGTIRIGDAKSGGTVVTVTLPPAEAAPNGTVRQETPAQER